MAGWCNTPAEIMETAIIRNGYTLFDNVEYNTLDEAKQAAEEYRKNKILSHFNIE